MTRGFRFPADPATPAQEKVLAHMVPDYLRRQIMATYSDLPSETLAGVLDMSPRTAAYLAAKVRGDEASPRANLVIDVLHSMLTGKIAGILGTRRTETAKWLFRQVYDYDLTENDLVYRLYLDDKGDQVDGSQLCDNWDFFRCLHAAFKLEYRGWLNR